MADVDFQWVMQVVFSTTIVVGAPVVALLSLFYSLPTWQSWVSFATRVGAAVWLVTALCVYGYARWIREEESDPPDIGDSEQGNANTDAE